MHDGKGEGESELQLVLRDLLTLLRIPAAVKVVPGEVSSSNH